MKRGNLKKCVIFYVLGTILAIAGLVLLIVSLTIRFKTYDSFAYIGGIVLLMGLSLVFLWYNFTIPYDETEPSVSELHTMPMPSAGISTDRKSLPRNSVMPSASESFELRESSNHHHQQRDATYDNPAFNDDSAAAQNFYDDDDDDDGLRVVTTRTGSGRTYHVNT